MTKPTIVLDACVLVPIRLANTLLWLAEAGAFQPLWSHEILDEVCRNLPKVGVEPDAARRRVSRMREAFDDEAMVEDFDHLVDDLTCDAKDRHVLAAALKAGADLILTFNTRDFPDDSVSPHGVEVRHPDEYLTHLLAEDVDQVGAVLERMTAARSRPPESVREFLAALTATVPAFANLAAAECLDGQRDRRVTEVPALIVTGEEEARASLGTPGDLTNPAQVALLWWEGLPHDMETTRSLTYDPSAWGGYQWASEHLAGRSLASRVIPAVDAPAQIAFMRFVHEVSRSSRAFEDYQAPMTFLTLVKLEDGTWRVWGLGPRIFSARRIREQSQS